MESPPVAKSRKPLIALLVLLLIAAGGASAWLVKGRLHRAPIGSALRSDLPVLELAVAFVNEKGESLPATRLLGGTAEPPAREREKGAAPCPELTGGDGVREGGPSAEARARSDSGCPPRATWRVRRHPIAASLYFQQAGPLLDLLAEKSPAREFLDSRLFRGIFHELLQSASVRGEELQLEGIEGAFLGRLLREAIAAHGALHYDIAHGRKGFVFSFVRDECPFAAKALPLIARRLARSAYRVAGLPESVLEMRIGSQRLFLAQQGARVYLANGLEALLNLLESLPPEAPRLPGTPLVLVLRGEAFVDKFFPLVTGEEGAEARFGFVLAGRDPGVLRVTSGKAGRHLRPRIFKGVLASIPHDAFSAAAFSFHLRPDMTGEEWNTLATEGPGDASPSAPEEAGVALVWELGSTGSPITRLGIAIASADAPQGAARFREIFDDPELTAVCGGGTVFLAATESGLLARMRESCAGQSLSVLDWERGARAGDLASAQVLGFVNPGIALRELFLAGGGRAGEAGDFAPEWKQAYQEAKAALQKDSEALLQRLPIWAYSGAVDPGAAETELKGMGISQGVWR